MLYPAVNTLINKNLSRYSLVVGVAKKAREISTEAEEKGEILNDKPVKISINEFSEGKYKIIENNNDNQIEQREIIKKIQDYKDAKKEDLNELN